MSQSANRFQKAKSHQNLINTLREDDCKCIGVTLCIACSDRVGEVWAVTSEDYEAICRDLDKGRFHE